MTWKSSGEGKWVGVQATPCVPNLGGQSVMRPRGFERSTVVVKQMHRDMARDVERQHVNWPFPPFILAILL
jgi:hypothetical protein